MCGICGLLSLTPAPAEPPAATAQRMADTLAHRGPDADGVWAEAGVALGHRRLSILDLSPLGAQPMASASGRWQTVYNGEIYTFAALRDELVRAGKAPEGGFRGGSDTEVLLAAVEAWGVEAALARFEGMFAIALWDRSERVLWLARDRMGQKPLYVGRAGADVVFGSELKALRAHPAFDAALDPAALDLYLRRSYVPGPLSIYRSVRKLPPGTVLRLPLDGADRLSPDALVAGARPYWSAAAGVAAGLASPFGGTDAEAESLLAAHLDRAVGMRLVADVPVGALLSGGIDSTAIVAAAQRVSSAPVKTFTIGFAEAAYDESGAARAVARHLGTDHTELIVTPADALAVVPRLPALYDEPFADSSQIPTFLVSQLARQSVTVALSGDGGDELFLGYNRHAFVPAVWNRAGGIPRPVRRTGARAVRAISPALWDRLYRTVAPALPARARIGFAGEQAHKLARVVDAASALGVYRRLVENGSPTVVRSLRGDAPAGTPDPLDAAIAALPPGLGLASQMALLDVLTYLPDDIHVKVDRASMGVGLEARAPFMDHRLAAFAWSLPETLKLRGGVGKWLLRRVVDRSVPPALMDRPKAGFGVPIDAWLRGPLRPWAEDLLDERRLRSEGLLDPAPIRRAWEDHLSGRRNTHHVLWAVLMFQQWNEATVAEPVPA